MVSQVRRVGSNRLTSLMARMLKMASTAPAAPSRWPTAPLVLLMLIWEAFVFPRSPSSRSLLTA